MPTPPSPDVICVGALLWDVIGRTERTMTPGQDLPGRIVRQPGGVALNIARALRRAGLCPTLLSVVGKDAEGDELLQACRGLSLNVDHVLRSSELPTDRYLAVEDAQGLVAAIADTHALEVAGQQILEPLRNGRLASTTQPWPGYVALDGNLTAELLAEITLSPLFASADLRVAPASPGKVARLRPLLQHPRVTLYANLKEASLLCGHDFGDSRAAALGLLALGAPRALVTDAARSCCDAAQGRPILCATPPAVTIRRVTGAGDTFMAAHLAAEARGQDPTAALSSALQAAAVHVAGESPS